MVEDEKVGKSGADEINDEAEEPEWWVSSAFANKILQLFTHQVTRYKLRVCLQMLSLGHALKTAY